MVKVAIAGASGYTGLELLRLLIKHTEVKITAVTSEKYQGQMLADVFPSFGGFSDLQFTPLTPGIADDCDILFLALPHTTALDRMPAFLKESCRVIDLSADFRLQSQETFQQWYAVPHAQSEALGQAVYGLPEIHRDSIKTAKLVANPGCYPTSVLLALLPIITTDWVDPDSIIADCKSGVSGAGRKLALGTLFSECNEAVSAYALGTHRHTPEIEQEISALLGQETRVTFSPHLVPMTRGMLATVYINLKKELALAELDKLYREFYKNEPFVRVLKSGTFANTHTVVASNFCDIGLAIDARAKRVIITSAIDNLVKGAAGQAIQNMNIMLGLDEKTALDAPGIFP
ncbi:N-acetyl-gamma-glutamyl-phosphate reductase [hydrothermal vent metagenome]|uniref:N-acetyl-gamma-glutamyl-phosphate reductase n=1 Tax=hydrothermal vent metagenome TaxID=652676 RepID=A0A3B1CNS5_9ZZZZ